MVTVRLSGVQVQGRQVQRGQVQGGKVRQTSERLLREGAIRSLRETALASLLQLQQEVRITSFSPLQETGLLKPFSPQETFVNLTFSLHNYHNHSFALSVIFRIEIEAN